MELNQKGITAAIRRQLRWDMKEEKKTLAAIKAGLENPQLVKHEVTVGSVTFARGRHLGATIKRAIRKYRKEHILYREVHICVEARLPGVTEFRLPRDLWEPNSRQFINDLLARS